MNRPKLRIFVLSAILLATAALVAVLVGWAPDAATAQEPQPAGTGIVNQPRGVTEPDYYIVRLADPPLAMYQGGISNLAATNPGSIGTDRLDARSVASQAYLAYLDAQQDALIAEIDSVVGGSADVLHRYRAAINGIAVWLTPAEAEIVATLPGVVAVTRNASYELDTDAGPEWIGAPAIWNGTSTGGAAGTQGEGMVVGILDSGINMDHPSFADVGGDGYDHPAPPGGFRGWCDPADPDYDPTLVCNDKLIGVYSYDASGTDPEDDNGHGSHTASTAAGNVVSATVSGLTVTISGVAPHAHIIAYDVCGGSTCPTTSLLGGLDDVTMDADLVSVLNYSISGGGDPWSSDIDVAFRGALAAGILPVTSAGNDGPGFGSINKQAPWTFEVAATTHNRIFGFELGISGPEPVSPTLVALDALAGNGATVTETIDVEIEYSALVEPGNFEGCDPYASNFFDGKIALISRGSCSFELKLNNAQAAGAIAGIIHNNIPGDGPINMNVGAATLPAYSISFEDGVDVGNWIDNNPTATARITPLSRLTDPSYADIMADFSSRGPAPDLDILMPDIAAPGVEILAAYATTDSGDPPEFSVIGGTSMASPHVAGSAILMRSLYPGWSAQEIRSALMTTAFTDLLKEDGATPADPFDYGAGRVDLTKSAEVGLVLDESIANFIAADPDLGGDPKELNLPSLQNSQCVATCSWQRVVTNATGETLNYSASVDIDGASGTVTPASFAVAAGESVTLTIEINSDTAGDGTWQFGRVDLTPVATEGLSFTPVAQQMPVAFIPSGSNLPNLLEIFSDSITGTTTISNVLAVTLTNSTVDTFGLTPGMSANIQLAVDPTNGDPYDDLSQVFYTTMTVPADTARIVAEIVASEAGDIDLFWGADTNNNGLPDESEELGRSTTPSFDEYLNFNQPPAGDYWILVQNWSSTSGNAEDAIVLSVGLVTVDEGNMTVTLPASNPLLSPFTVTVDYDDYYFASRGDYWYGAFGVAPDSESDYIGFTAVDFHYTGDSFLYLPIVRR